MNDLKEKLRKVPQFSSINDKDLDWLISKSVLRETEVGGYLFQTGDPIKHMHIILEGKLSIMTHQNGNYFESGSAKENEIAGALPFSRGMIAQANGIAKSKLRILAFPREAFKEMIQNHYELVEPLVHTMSSRVREFTAQSLQNEKLISLGKISAGLAHELNNPSAAIVRSSSDLKKHLSAVPDRFKRVISIRLSPSQVDEVNNILFSRVQSGVVNSFTLMEKNEKEDEIADFLEDNGMNDGYSPAEIFVEFCLTIEDLKKIQSIVTDDYFITVVEWLESVLTTERLVNEIENSAKRMNDLVSSVKSYSHMDRANDMQPEDIHIGIKNTITILNHKLKQKNIDYIENFSKSIPKIKMFVSEINQVWTNLIDNAIDSMEKNGTLIIKTFLEYDNLIVEIEDSGKGIPENIKTRIFDPFFTTKDIGQGTGMGLDISQKIISKHNGRISFISEPGKTVFTVSLPTN